LSEARTRLAPRVWFVALIALLAAIVVLSMCVGATRLEPATVLRGVAARAGLAEPLAGHLQTIVELRL
jgi:hypothetical protein